MLSPIISYRQTPGRRSPGIIKTLACLLFSSLALASTVWPQFQQVASAAQLAHSGSIYFPETAHKTSNGFLSYWLWNGQAARWGKPITDEFTEDGMTVQYFERGRLEYHANVSESQTIQSSLTGTLLTQGRDFHTVASFKNTSEAAYFAQTKHSVKGKFLGYWNNNGGLAAFGYPISEQVSEGGHTVQYFQRARFELTSGGGIWLGYIGKELLAKRASQKAAATPKPDFQMTFTGGATWFPGNWNRIISLNKSWGNLPANYKGYGLYAAMPADLNLYGRWGRVTKGNKSIWVQFIDVIAYQDIPQVRADGKVIDLGVESFQQFAGLDAGVLSVKVDVAWPGFKPDFAQ